MLMLNFSPFHRLTIKFNFGGGNIYCPGTDHSYNTFYGKSIKDKPYVFKVIIFSWKIFQWGYFYATGSCTETPKGSSVTLTATEFKVKKKNKQQQTTEQLLHFPDSQICSAYTWISKHHRKVNCAQSFFRGFLQGPFILHGFGHTTLCTTAHPSATSSHCLPTLSLTVWVGFFQSSLLVISIHSI